MTYVTALAYVAFLVISFAMVLHAILATRSWKAGGVQIGLYALFLPAAYLSLTMLLGNAKPVWLEITAPRVDEAYVIGSQIEEGKGIYVYMRLPGDTAPMSYKLPWNKQQAEQLAKAQAEAGKNGTGVAIRLPFERTWDRLEPKFYAIPQPALPPKDLQRQPPINVPHVDI